MDAELVLLGGPNGHGKTSLAEAIEWLFYGTTKRRVQGERFSRTEYAGTFVNAHASSPAEVEAEVEFPDGRRLVLCRRTKSGRQEESETLVDGTPSSFAPLGLVGSDVGYPVVAQHGLQGFILSRPKERRDAIGAALGLEDVTLLKNALDGAARAFGMAAPTTVRQTRVLLRGCAQGLTEFTETKLLSTRWALDPPVVQPDNDVSCLVTAAKRLTGAASDVPGDLLEPLRDNLRAVSRSVFDDAVFRLPADLGKVLDDLDTDWGKVRTSCQTIAGELAAIAAYRAAYLTELVSFWKKGLELAPEGEDCPMCEEPTLDAEKRAELERRIGGASADLEHRAKAVKEAREQVPQLEGFGRSLVEPARSPISDESRGLLRGLLADDLTALDGFLPEYEAWSSAVCSLSAARDELVAFLRSLPEQLSSPSSYPELVRKSTDLPSALSTQIGKAREVTARYAGVWRDFEPKLTARVSRSSQVAPVVALGKSLKASDSIKEVGAYHDLLAAARSVARKAEGFVQRKQKGILDTRGAEVVDLYKKLNPGAEVGFAAMEPGNEEVKLHATSFGRRMSAAATLSECQLNCLGLSFWVMQALVPTSPFGFIVLDDPVQSMDDDHFEAFASVLVPYLLVDKGKQVLLFSHEKRLVDKARALTVGLRVLEYGCESYERQGPVIVEQVRLARLLAELEALSAGNEKNREYAVDRIRILVESFIRELHLKVTAVPAPPELDSASPKQLLDLFRSIPGTTPAQHAGLSDTVKFSDPSHHTEVGYTVPVATNIRTHVDRMRQMMKQFGLV